MGTTAGRPSANSAAFPRALVRGGRLPRVGGAKRTL